MNKDVKEAIVRKKDAHKEMCKSRIEANKARNKSKKNQAKKVVTKAMKEAAEQELRELSIVINVPTRGLLAVETKNSFVLWLAN